MKIQIGSVGRVCKRDRKRETEKAAHCCTMENRVCTKVIKKLAVDIRKIL